MTAPRAAPDLEPVIGLEVHVQLATRSKLFCACRNEYGAAPNAHVCPVCTGQPGVLPVLNEQALSLGLSAALALGCEVPASTKFDRKNYFYPDLPKGYQISQYDRPLGLGGAVELAGDGGATRRVGVARVHLEEDAGKTLHPPGENYSLVDLNRAGVPLLEIVSAPDLRSPEEAHRYLVALKRTLRYARVSECDMEKGSLRCDANVSLRARGSSALNARVEIKNLNSFRNVERALAHDIARQTTLLAAGEAVLQETRMWREEEECTAPLRSKEEEHDYRYFPEPDLPEFAIPPELVERLRAGLPEMPAARLERYIGRLGLPAETAAALAADWEVADYYERCLAAGGVPARAVASFVLGAVLQEANARHVSVSGVNIPPASLAEVARLVEAGALSHQAARKVLAEIAASGQSAAQAVASLGLEQVSDRAQLAVAVDAALAAAPVAVAQYRAGKQNALNALVGAVMKATRGKADPKLARQLLLERLGA